MSFWKSDEKLPVFAFLIPGLRSNIKHSTQYFITKWNTSKLVKNTQLRVVFSTLFSVFYLVMKHCVSSLIYYFQVILKLEFLRSYSTLAIWQSWMGRAERREKKALVFTKKNSPRRTYLLPVVALRIANQDFCARLVISRIAQDTGRLYSIGTNDIDRKKMLQSYIAKPIVWRILQEVYLPVFMLSMLINHNKTRKLNAFSLP